MTHLLIIFVSIVVDIIHKDFRASVYLIKKKKVYRVVQKKVYDVI